MTNPMKRTLILMMAWAMTAVTYGQQASSANVTVNTVIPDNDPNGLVSGLTLSGLSGTVEDVTVDLDITGGYDGDLYAYLVGPDGGFSVLLNRVGVSGTSTYGYSDPGLDVTLSDTAANSIQYYQNDSPTYNLSGQLTGTWQPEGVNIDPQSAPSAFATAGQTAMLSSFDGTDGNGQWDLFIADVSPGGQGTLVSWGVTVTTVPEPSALALAGIGLVGAMLVTRRRGPNQPGNS
jgi:subtilisin-like proprotein convertase family protein